MMPVLTERKPGWFTRTPNRQFISWALQQLNIQPYQHLLEVGYGGGHLTEEVARALRIGFIAGIEPSIPLYQQAYRRNKRFVHQQLLQLHIGQPCELPYPSHYFHTVYSTNIHSSCKNVSLEILRLASLLKSRGRLVLLFEAGRDSTHLAAVTALREAYREAGLIGCHIEHQPLSSGNCLAIIGFKA